MKREPVCNIYHAPMLSDYPAITPHMSQNMFPVITPSISQTLPAPESSLTNVPMKTSSGEEGYRGLTWYNWGDSDRITDYEQQTFVQFNNDGIGLHKLEETIPGTDMTVYGCRFNIANHGCGQHIHQDMTRNHYQAMYDQQIKQEKSAWPLEDTGYKMVKQMDKHFHQDMFGKFPQHGMYEQQVEQDTYMHSQPQLDVMHDRINMLNNINCNMADVSVMELMQSQYLNQDIMGYIGHSDNMTYVKPSDGFMNNQYVMDNMMYWKTVYDSMMLNKVMMCEQSFQTMSTTHKPAVPTVSKGGGA